MKLLSEELQKIEHSAEIAPMLNYIKLISPETYAHSCNVAKLISRILPYTDIHSNIYEEVIKGAFLHDIGKVSVPLSILQKPACLTVSEYEIIKQHSSFGNSIVHESFSSIVADMCLYHHEKMDGSGYPFGIRKIPSYVRLLTILDIYEALVSYRVYKQKISPKNAILQLQDKVREGKLDGKYVEALSIHQREVFSSINGLIQVEPLTIKNHCNKICPIV